MSLLTEPFVPGTTVQLEGRAVLLIDAFNDEGLHLARQLAERGAHIALIASGTQMTWAERICQTVRQTGRRCLILPAQDSPAALPATSLIERITAELGPLQAFVRLNGDLRSIFDARSISLAALQQPALA
ncbi:MAG: SDR family oxidoreductase [Anaerolineales bacterium]|nr:SDR family oxidoreductase [Anaerolineales bacterium]MCB0015769.1 SDR family oxidoreductase [Anaerolineales bacterium]